MSNPYAVSSSDIDGNRSISDIDDDCITNATGDVVSASLWPLYLVTMLHHSNFILEIHFIRIIEDEQRCIISQFLFLRGPALI